MALLARVLQVKQRLLVTGAGGNLGRGLVTWLVADGWIVRTMVLPGDCSTEDLRKAGAEVIEGDVTKPETLISAVQGCQAVLHMAGVILHRDAGMFEKVNHKGTRNLLAACDAERIGHFVHISSISVTYGRLTPYGRSKRKGEEVIRRGNVPWTIVRPTLLVSETGSEEFHRFLGFVRKFSWLPLPGGGRALKRPLYEPDAREGLVRLMARVRAGMLPSGRTYNLAGADVVSTAEMVHKCAAYLGVQERRIVDVPAKLVRLAADAFDMVLPQPWAQAAAAMDENAAPSIEDAKRDFGYDPRPLDAWLEQCVRPLAGPHVRK